jgi:hypothetical protein
MSLIHSKVTVSIEDTSNNTKIDIVVQIIDKIFIAGNQSPVTAYVVRSLKSNDVFIIKPEQIINIVLL